MSEWLIFFACNTTFSNVEIMIMIPTTVLRDSLLKISGITSVACLPRKSSPVLAYLLLAHYHNDREHAEKKAYPGVIALFGSWLVLLLRLELSWRAELETSIWVDFNSTLQFKFFNSSS